MRKIFHLLVPLFFVIFLFGCEGSGSVRYNYILENQSGVDIKLKVYFIKKDGSVLNLKYLDLNDGQKMQKTYEDHAPYHGYNFSDFFRINQEEINTVEVLYNNSKKIVFLEQRNKSLNECETIFGEEVPCDPRNFLNAFYYKDTNEHYIFTVEDYDNAIDCEGDCD